MYYCKNRYLMKVVCDKNLKRLINLIKNVIKLGKPDYGKIKLRKEENLVTYPDIKKAKRLLNWSPRTKLINGIIKTIKSY